MSEWDKALQSLAVDEKTQEELREAQLELDHYRSLGPVNPRTIPTYTPKRGAATAVALLSDVHVGERVDPEDVPGALNAYSPDIAAKRMEQYFQRLVALVKMYRRFTSVDNLVLAILGDIITGYLHDDQRESNYMSPTEETLFAIELLCGGIEYLLSKGGFSKIIIPCCYGNHGRNTVKIRSKTAAKNSYEWMMYQTITRMWGKSKKRVEFHIANAAHQYVNISGFMCRFHHGDKIRYNGGVGGISIPLNKAIAQWDKICRADYDFLGHWHQCRDFGKATVNGSMIGFNSFALDIKADYEDPRQSLSFIDHKRGKCAHMSIWTDYLPPAIKEKHHG